MTAPTDHRARREFLLLGLAILVFYGVLLWAPLIYDDRVLILGNPRITGPWGGLRASLLLPGEYAEAYEPLVVFFHRILFALSGERPFAYRLTSLILHWANAGFVLTLYSRFLRDKRLAFLAALLFALFPAHVEVLAGSTFKKHLLVALFTLASLWLMDRRSWPAWTKVGGAWSLFTLALACKESAVILPLIAGARLIERRREDRSAPGGEAPFLFGGWAAILACYLLLRARIGSPSLHPLAGGSWLTHVLTSANIFSWYMLHLIVPFPLSLEHSLGPIISPLDGLGWLAAACAAGACGAMIALYRHDRKFFFAAVWIAISLAPFLNLLSSLNYSLVADRYLYMASIGFFLLAALSLEKFMAADSRHYLRPWAGPILLGIAVVYACVGIRYAATFSDPREVWENAVRRAPLNPRAHSALGSVLRQAGENEAAAAEFRRAMSLDPSYPEPYLDLAGVYSNAGRAAEAVTLAEEGVRRRPDAAGWKILGVYRLKAGLSEQALDALRRAERIAPTDADIRLDLGFAELSSNLLDSAQESFQTAAHDRKTRAQATLGLGKVARARGRHSDSAAYFESALALDPWNPQIVWCLAQAYVALGRKREAIKLYDAVITHIDGIRPTAPAKSARELDALREELERERATLTRTDRAPHNSRSSAIIPSGNEPAKRSHL